MFKDYDEYLSVSLKVYLFVLLIVFIMKLVGLDYFGLDINNPAIVKLNEMLLKYNINFLWFIFTIYIELYIYLALVCENKKMHIYAVIGTLLNVAFQFLTRNADNISQFYVIYSFLITIIIPIIATRKIIVLKQIKYIIIINIYQLISMFIRNIGINDNYDNFIIDSLLNIDQLLLLAITYILKFKKGEILCIQEVGFSSLRKIDLKKSLKRLQENLLNFGKQSKVDKLSFIIFFLLSFTWNIFTIITVLIIATLNETFIECIFILTTFWLTKRVFGKAFHLQSMIQCFIVSNITYYTLNRLTSPVGISILFPVMLGVGLSYFTSKLVKKTEKPLYRGMPKDLFEYRIAKIYDVGSLNYNICYEYFVNRESALYLSNKYNYSVDGIKKIKDRTNLKLKELL